MPTDRLRAAVDKRAASQSCVSAASWPARRIAQLGRPESRALSQKQTGALGRSHPARPSRALSPRICDVAAGHTRERWIWAIHLRLFYFPVCVDVELSQRWIHMMATNRHQQQSATRSSSSRKSTSSTCNQINSSSSASLTSEPPQQVAGLG